MSIFRIREFMHEVQRKFPQTRGELMLRNADQMLQFCSMTPYGTSLFLFAFFEPTWAIAAYLITLLFSTVLFVYFLKISVKEGRALKIKTLLYLILSLAKSVAWLIFLVRLDHPFVWVGFSMEAIAAMALITLFIYLLLRK